MSDILMFTTANRWHMDAKEIYIKVQVVNIFMFHNWSLHQLCEKEGRRRQGLKYKSSLETFWKIFRLIFEREI